VVLQGTALVRADPGLVVRGVYVAKDNRHSIGLLHGYDPTLGVPVKGVVVPPNRMREIVLGLVLPRPGLAAFHGITVLYSSGGTDYKQMYPVSGRLCAPAQKYSGRCQPPE
jgi:hypothetical protein